MLKNEFDQQKMGRIVLSTLPTTDVVLATVNVVFLNLTATAQ